ncbi:Na+/H+ antiporter subunit D [Cohnella sp. LGH]|uniref:Na+/H+ antiporter subunit D n=1 Tax=Cohnella sp. LGH TaxID=1619153 RepID=UPI001ADD25B8|nr:Na+/H+ antiporter subunit D [Cohnella sp. LGH]QTH45364.1 Na+/H+ antiporter subunit D [Cohnella sp. LGH]
MNNSVVLPLIIPLLTAILLVFLPHRVRAQRMIALLGVLGNLVAALALIGQIDRNGIQTLHLGGWAPPYGIVFVADMLSGLLVLTTSVISLFCLWFMFRSVEKQREKMYIYPLFQFLLVGVYGSFLTGDLFNLFVCFEVMLIASYAMMVLGGSKRQLRETLKYMMANILSSALFVAAMAYLYGAVGTLNMAHLSQRVAELGQGGMLDVIAVLLLLVFSLKAGLFLFFWLPGSYSAPPAAVRALFGGLLTKVGLYAMIRVFSLIFYHDSQVTHTWIAAMSAATMILGSIGASAYRDVPRIINYNVIIGVGFVGFGLSLGAVHAWDGIIFYLLHDMLAKTLLFVLAGMLIAAAGTERLQDMGGLIKRYPLLGWLIFGTMLALVGIPPLSGFPGKLLLLRSGIEAESYWLFGIGLASSFFVLYSLLRIFRMAFWGAEKDTKVDKGMGEEGRAQRAITGMAPATLGMFALLIAMGLAGERVYGLVRQASEVLGNAALYIDAVMKG